MPDNIGPNEKSIRIASLVMQPGFVNSLNQLDPGQFRSSIALFLKQDPSIPLIARIWLNVLKTRFVPFRFCRMIVLNMLRYQSSKLLKNPGRLDRPTRHRIKYALKVSKRTGS